MPMKKSVKPDNPFIEKMTNDIRRCLRLTDKRTYEFEAVIQKAHDDTDTAYVAVPIDIKTEFGKGRLKVHATFNEIPYDGIVVNMGVKNPDGSICYIIGLRKDIRAKIGKQPGDSVCVTIRERESE